MMRFVQRAQRFGAGAAIASVITVIGNSPAASQDAAMPDGWRAVTDAPGRFVAAGVEPNLGDAWNFNRMPPGWHITVGPGMVLFDPANRAVGRYRLETEFFLFPNPTDEPVGLFVGGSDLDGPARWIGFLIRRDGTAGIVQHRGNERTQLAAFTGTDSLPPHPGDDMQRVTIAIDAEADSVRFIVNGTVHTALPRAGLALDGPFGFRIGRGLNLHIVRLDVTTRLAPPRAQPSQDDR